MPSAKTETYRHTEQLDDEIDPDAQDVAFPIAEDGLSDHSAVDEHLGSCQAAKAEACIIKQDNGSDPCRDARQTTHRYRHLISSLTGLSIASLTLKMASCSLLCCLPSACSTSACSSMQASADGAGRGIDGLDCIIMAIVIASR